MKREERGREKEREILRSRMFFPIRRRHSERQAEPDPAVNIFLNSATQYSIKKYNESMLHIILVKLHYILSVHSER